MKKDIDRERGCTEKSFPYSRRNLLRDGPAVHEFLVLSLGEGFSRAWNIRNDPQANDHRDGAARRKASMASEIEDQYSLLLGAISRVVKTSQHRRDIGGHLMIIIESRLGGTANPGRRP